MAQKNTNNQEPKARCSGFHLYMIQCFGYTVDFQYMMVTGLYHYLHLGFSS